MEKDNPIPNKRARDRFRRLKSGKIIFNKGGSVIDCTVRNVSETGALLHVQSAATLPQIFELRWDDNVRGCTVIWQKADKLGVKFSV